LDVLITRAKNGFFVSAMSFYKKLRDDLIKQYFEFNPYNPFVASKLVNGQQVIVCCHVDDLNVSPMKYRVIDDFLAWVKDTYGAIGEVKTTHT
jgi:UDP-glucose 4-epimerase